MGLFKREEKKDRNKKIEELSHLIEKKRMAIRFDKEDKKAIDKDVEKLKLSEKEKTTSLPRIVSRTKTASRPARVQKKTKDFSKENVKFTAYKSAYSGEKNTVKEVEERIREILEKDIGRFSGQMTIDIEKGKIQDIQTHKVEVDEDITDKLITKSQFDDVLKYFEDPNSVRYEISEMAKGLEKEKIEKAIEMGAEAIIKKVRVKADGTLEYNFIASVKK